MRLLRLALKPHTAVPVMAVGFGSAACAFLVMGRIAWTGNFRYASLVWNLFLAWLPLAFSLLALENLESRSPKKWKIALLGGAWLLFLPNSPYIFTDLVHLTTYYFSHFWIDLGLVLSCALTGLVAGFISLYLMQAAVVRMAGVVAGWIFVFGAASLCAFGIYLGRFLRLNSWDILFQPRDLYHGLFLANPLSEKSSFGFQVLFGSFIFIAYVMLYSLTYLRSESILPASPAASPQAA